MLFRPCAKHFYTCGYGARFALEEVIDFVRTIGNVWRTFCTLALTNIKEHPINVIRTHLGNDDVAAEDPAAWPVWSGSLLNLVGSKFWPDSRATSTTKPRDLPTLKLCLNEPIQGTPSPGTTTLPDNPVLGTPYHITDKDELRRVASMMTLKDIIIPLVGKTNAGKSRTMNTLAGCLQIEGSDTAAIPSHGHVNGSTLPYIMYYKQLEEGRVFIIDLPGIGAKEDAASYVWVADTIDQVLDPFRGIIGCAFVIMKDPPLKDEKVVVVVVILI
eukprot:TRINITY_DN5173_c0_g1_i2.p1 TRINITY_DN5173_c0_g1~~TRINITY_DN5173_c0_g1_i2.p1  ORF type:complete len:272 (-),score=24.67 TRINITY_DN5173_c0_g1_i2:420-1235(-)